MKKRHRYFVGGNNANGLVCRPVHYDYFNKGTFTVCSMKKGNLTKNSRTSAIMMVQLRKQYLCAKIRLRLVTMAA